ncbi:MAG: hypothetical protein HY265_00425 [Deltaproteobacteria bacterium]|nr:hypothetical protein [Deltaproteobacteria bacterium]
MRCEVFLISNFLFLISIFFVLTGCAVVTYNGESVSLLSLQEKRLYRNYPLPIDASRLPQYILGLPAAAMRNYESAEHPSKGWIESQENPPPCLYVTSKGEQILINTEGAIQEIISHASDLRGKDYNMHVSMASYKEVNSFLFPFSISISNKSFHISIKYNDMELNQQISEDLFSLSLMQGIEDIAP